MGQIVNQSGICAISALPLAISLTLGLNELGYLSFSQGNWLGDRRPHFAVAVHYAALQTAKLKLARNREEALAILEQTCREFCARDCRVSFKDTGNGLATWTWRWRDPNPSFAQASAVDRLRLDAKRNYAAWSLDDDTREPALDMNLPMLMLEFMGQLLRRVVEVAPGVGSISDRGGFVRTQDREGTLSLKELKRRL